MVLSAETDVKPDNLRFLNRRFMDGLVVIYKDFGVLEYEFIGQDKFAVFRHGEILAYKITQNGTEKIFYSLLDGEINRLFPSTAVVTYALNKFSVNSVVKLNDAAESLVPMVNQFEFSNYEKDINQVLISENKKNVALIFTNKLILLTKLDPEKPYVVKTLKNLRVG